MESVDRAGTWNAGDPVMSPMMRVVLGVDARCLSLRVRLPDIGPKNDIAMVVEG